MNKPLKTGAAKEPDCNAPSRCVERLVRPGDYVLATKWHDGDPEDHWVIGWYSHQDGDRHFVVGTDGQQYRANGFRRVKKISHERGAWMIKHSREFRFTGFSVWHFARCKMVWPNTHIT